MPGFATASSNAHDGHRLTGYWVQFTNHFLQHVSEASLVEGLIMVGATNYPSRLDPALLRSGRFGTHIVLELPDEATRAAILRHYAGTFAWERQLRGLSVQLAGYSGADLEKLVSLAKARARRKGEAFTHQHIHEQIQQREAHLSSEQRRRLRAYDAGKAIVRDVLGIATTSLMSPTTRTELADHLVYLMAGRAGEEVVFSEVSNLGVVDLKAATALAMAIELELGIGESGLIHLIEGNFEVLGSPNIAGSVRRHIENGMERAIRILVENTDELHRRLGPAQCRRESEGVAGKTGLVH